MTETSALPPDSAPPSQDASTSGLALASLIMGIGTFLLSILTGIPAIICGHLAHSKIKASGGALKGSGMALAGLILGYLSILMVPVIAILAGLSIPVAMKALNKAEKVTMISNLGNLQKALQLHAANNGGNYPATLNELVPDILTKEGLEELTTVKDRGRLIYVPGLQQNSPSDFLILYQNFDDGETIIGARLDNSTGILTPEEFNAIAAKQGLPPIKE
jgi:type II secretory pathway pseudopilin PulG